MPEGDEEVEKELSLEEIMIVHQMADDIWELAERYENFTELFEAIDMIKELSSKLHELAEKGRAR